jgi:protein SCO1/2
MQRQFLFLAVFAVAALTGCDRASNTPSFRATDITGAEFGRQFQLSDFNGRPRTLSDFRGKVVAVFFGYTHCPDVCPTTLSELAAAVKKLGPEGDKVQVLFVTADPERDTPAVLKQYVGAFNPTFLGLRGTPEQTAQVAKEFKVILQKNPGGIRTTTPSITPPEPTSHDAGGKLRLYVGYGRAPMCSRTTSESC